MSQRPTLLSALSFSVSIRVPGDAEELCRAAFAECSGLQLQRQVKTIREGGDNARMIHLYGPLQHGQITLKRGMTPDFGLWSWFTSFDETSMEQRRAAGSISIHSSDGRHTATFELESCVPVRLVTPSLNAQSGIIAIEECVLAYETVTVKGPGASGGGGQATSPGGSLLSTIDTVVRTLDGLL